MLTRGVCCDVPRGQFLQQMPPLLHCGTVLSSRRIPTLSISSHLFPRLMWTACSRDIAKRYRMCTESVHCQLALRETENAGADDLHGRPSN
jgi:hypothetical protein